MYCEYIECIEEQDDETEGDPNDTKLCNEFDDETEGDPNDNPMIQDE